MAIIGSASKYEIRDAVLEPPGGEALLRARAMLGVVNGSTDVSAALGQRLAALDVFAAAWRLDVERAEAELRVAAATVSDAAWDECQRPREPSVYECARCGWYPAVRMTFTRYASILFSWAERTYTQSLCRRCGMRRYYVAQAICLAFGFLGIGLIFTPFMLIRNVRGKWRMRRLPRPHYRAAEVVTKRRRPASPVVPVTLRVVGWAIIVAVVVFVTSSFAPGLLSST